MATMTNPNGGSRSTAALITILLLAGITAGSAWGDDGVPDPAVIHRAFTGAWSNPNQSGHGLVLEVIGREEGPQALLVYWFGYLEGDQLWLSGSADLEPGTRQATAVMYITRGGTFPNRAFDPVSVVTEKWGSVTLSFQDCDHGSIVWEAEGAFAGDFGSGELPIERMTSVVECAAISP